MAVDGLDTQIKNHRNFSWLIQLIYDIFSCHKDSAHLSIITTLLKHILN